MSKQFNQIITTKAEICLSRQGRRYIRLSARSKSSTCQYVRFDIPLRCAVTPIPQEKAVRWLSGAVKSPPFSFEARLEAGGLLGSLQQGQVLSLPHSRPMPRIGSRCHELKIKDHKKEWRIIYRTDPDVILVLEVFLKTTKKTPQGIIDICKKRLTEYDSAQRGGQNRGQR